MQEFQTLEQVLAGFPDNTDNLIWPVNDRNGAIGGANLLGVVYAAGPGTVTLTTGVWASVNQALAIDYLGGQGLEEGPGGELVPNVSIGTVPPGFKVPLLAMATMTLDPAEGDTYELALAVNGTVQPHTVTPYAEPNQPGPTPSYAAPVTLIGFVPLEVDAPNTVEVYVRNLDSGADIDVLAFALSGVAFVPFTPAVFNGSNEG